MFTHLINYMDTRVEPSNLLKLEGLVNVTKVSYEQVRRVAMELGFSIFDVSSAHDLALPSLFERNLAGYYKTVMKPEVVLCLVAPLSHYDSRKDSGDKYFDDPSSSRSQIEFVRKINNESTDVLVAMIEKLQDKVNEIQKAQCKSEEERKALELIIGNEKRIREVRDDIAKRREREIERYNEEEERKRVAERNRKLWDMDHPRTYGTWNSPSCSSEDPMIIAVTPGSDTAEVLVGWGSLDNDQVSRLDEVIGRKNEIDPAALSEVFLGSMKSYTDKWMIYAMKKIMKLPEVKTTSVIKVQGSKVKVVIGTHEEYDHSRDRYYRYYEPTILLGEGDEGYKSYNIHAFEGRIPATVQKDVVDSIVRSTSTKYMTPVLMRFSRVVDAIEYGSK
jgi:hypothetical protein